MENSSPVCVNRKNPLAIESQCNEYHIGHEVFIIVSVKTPQMTTRCSGFWTTYGSASQSSLSRSDITNTPGCTPSSSRPHTKSERELLSFLSINLLFMNAFFRWGWCNYHVWHEMRHKGQENTSMMFIIMFQREPLKKKFKNFSKTKYSTAQNIGVGEFV